MPAPVEPACCRGTTRAPDTAALKDALLGEVQKAKKFFYGTVVAQAQQIDVEGDRVVFTFAPQQRRCARSSSRTARGWKKSRRSSPDARSQSVGVEGAGPAPAKAGGSRPRRRRRPSRCASRR